MNRRNAVLALLAIVLGDVTPVTTVAATSGESGEIHRPVVIKRVDPVYPADAREERVRGVVIIESVISKEGRVTSMKVLKSVDPRLDEAARAALLQWEFQPGTLDGKPVDVLFNVTFNFQLE